MFDENQLTIVKWHSHNKQYFTNLGFEFTKIGDKFVVPAKLLPKYSKSIVKCICDYCGKEYEVIYSRYSVASSSGKLACSDCVGKKKTELLQEKYGVSYVGQLPEFRARQKKAMKEKYGYEYALQTKQGQENFKQSMKEKYGVGNPVYSPELRLKSHQSMYQHGLVPTSKPERKLVEILIEKYGKENCYPSCPLEGVVFDCLVKFGDINIDVEYDGDYWHKNKIEKDDKRNRNLISKGYKILRIKGNKKDTLPKIELIDKSIKILLQGEDLIYIDMNNKMNI